MAFWDKWFPKKKPVDTALSYCVPEAIFCAWAWGAMRKDPIRIIVQNIRPGVDHVQAEAQIKGEWTPLTPKWDHDKCRISVSTWTRHFPRIPYRYVGLQEFINEQIQYTQPITVSGS